MLNLKQISYIGLALCALTACSLEDSSVAGTTTVPNASAENISSSSEMAASSSDGTAVGSSQANSANAAQDIVFSTKATAKEPLSRGEIVVYGEENGAIAACTADGKSYEAKLKVNNGLVEKSIEMKNFGSSCDSVLAEFIASCHSNVSVNNGKNSEQSCDENGNVKAYCFDDGSIPADTTVDFNKAFNSLSNFSGELCYAITTGANSTTMLFSTLSSTSRDMSSSSGIYVPPTNPVDPNEKCLEETEKKCGELDVQPVDPRQELPSYSAVGIDTNSNRSFVIKPNVEVLNVSDAERSVLDSLVRAYPRKTKTDAIDGMTIFLSYEAEYRFTTEMDEYYVRGDGSERSAIDVYREEKGVKSSMVLPLDVYYGGQGYISVTTLQVSESSILYLVRATLGSYASLLIDTFRTECEATSGSFYEYGPMADVAVACAVKNFSGITFDGILSQQKNLFRNAYATFVQPVVD